MKLWVTRDRKHGRVYALWAGEKPVGKGGVFCARHPTMSWPLVVGDEPGSQLAFEWPPLEPGQVLEVDWPIVLRIKLRAASSAEPTP